uniref:DNA repair RAD52-like protein 1, mitochondrial n=1 Tax=Noccaea caerulescens TaxID=107243 RepID=A0A1J3HIG1_NOCCA
MASLGLRLKTATWTLRSGAAATVSRGCSWEMGKIFRGFSSEPESDVPTSGISRPLAEILKELNKKVPDTVIKTRLEDGCSIKYIPWHIVNRIMNLHAPEWSGEVRSVNYSPNGETVTVVYRVTLYGTDAEVF